MKSALRERFLNIVEWFKESGTDLLIAFVLLLVFYFIGAWVRKLAHQRARKNPERGVVLGFIGNVLMAIFILIGLFLFLNEMNWNRVLTGLLAGAGFISLVIGFAFKDIGENFLAGVLLAFSRPFSIGDLIDVEHITGRVLQLNLRNTHLRTVEGRDVFVPNSMLVNRVLVNYTRDGLMRHSFVLGIDYDSDIKRAIQIALLTMEKETQVQQGGELKPYILIQDFGQSTINLKVYFWTNLREIEVASEMIKSRVMRKVYEAFDKEGISMPGNIVELKRYQPVEKDEKE